MKVYWRYRCDNGHSWAFVRDEDAVEREEDTLCPEGHEAVTLTKQNFADQVELAFRPAARTVDVVTGRVEHEGRYFVIVTDVHRKRTWFADQEFSWNDAVQFASKFDGLSGEKAWLLIGRLKSLKSTESKEVAE